MKNIPIKLKKWSIQPFIKQFYKQLPEAEIFLVGGAVRDMLLNRPTTDFDLVVRNVSKPTLEKFLTAHGKVNLVGKKFGVFKFVPKGWVGTEIDIALPRTEHSINFSGGYKDFKINSSAKLKIEDDLGRRDFTINAIAYDVKNKKLLDPYQGLQDLNHKVIRAVGAPTQRFKEDYSRMLRAIRFSAQLNFVIEHQTWSAIKRQIKHLKTVGGKPIVPFEVIAKELNKAMSANATKTIQLLDESGALKILIPELLKMKNCPQPTNWHSEGDCWIHTMLAVENLADKKFKAEFKNQQPTPELIWATIFHDLGKPYTIKHEDRIRFNNHDNVSAQKWRLIAERLKLSSAGVDINRVEKIIAKHMLPANAKHSEMKDTTIEKYFFKPDFPGTELLMLIFADISATIPEKTGRPDFTQYRMIKKRINRLKQRLGNKNGLIKPLVTGNDLIKNLKLPSGPLIGKLLISAREAQLAGKIKTKQQALAFLRNLLK
ncbi:MAG: CCA tRNA nucleotidyltransferase [Candidatus Buchananbacteria bacterium]|nr:CCA tRNA nucleotidyltransferase [Candidatus Buchananbacteria bacterium]